MSTTRSVDEHLPEAESFEGDHLSEAAIVLLADGATSLLLASAVAHASSCAHCASRIGEAALASAEVHAAFAALPSETTRAAAAADEPARRRAGQAAWAIGSGLAVAALASAPAVSGLAKGISELRRGLEVLVAVSLQVEQALRLASGRLETMRAVASWAATFALVAAGVWIARRGPRAVSDQAADDEAQKVVVR